MTLFRSQDLLMYAFSLSYYICVPARIYASAFTIFYPIQKSVPHTIKHHYIKHVYIYQCLTQFVSNYQHFLPIPLSV